MVVHVLGHTQPDGLRPLVRGRLGALPVLPHTSDAEYDLSLTGTRTWCYFVDVGQESGPGQYAAGRGLA